jgi:hypothetical protein
MGKIGFVLPGFVALCWLAGMLMDMSAACRKAL